MISYIELKEKSKRVQDFNVNLYKAVSVVYKTHPRRISPLITHIVRARDTERVIGALNRMFGQKYDYFTDRANGLYSITAISCHANHRPLHHYEAVLLKREAPHLGISPASTGNYAIAVDGTLITVDEYGQWPVETVPKHLRFDFRANNYKNKDYVGLVKRMEKAQAQRWKDTYAPQIMGVEVYIMKETLERSWTIYFSKTKTFLTY